MVRCRGWLRRQLVSEQVFAGDGHDGNGAPALDWLGRQLTAAALPGATAHVVLSDQLVKSFVFERVAGLRHLGELKASIRARFEEIFGLNAEEWEISADLSPLGSRFLVCAVDRRQLASLRQVFGGHRIALASVRPFFVSEFNRWRQRIGKGGTWFSVVERDGLTLAWLADGNWTAVRTYRTLGEPTTALPQLLARERLSNGIEASGPAVWLAGMAPDAVGGESETPPVSCLGNATWPGRTPQWSRDYRLALSGVWP
jgi:hypothetical protein